MADPGNSEPDLSGAALGRSSVGSAVNVNIPGLKSTIDQVNQMTEAIGRLTAGLTTLQSKQSAISASMGNLTKSLSGLGQAASGAWSAAGSAPTNTGSTMGNLATGAASGAWNLTKSMFGSVNQNGWMRDLLMFPTRFITGQVDTNRNLALASSAALGQQAFGWGASMQNIMAALGNGLGGVMSGNPQELLQLMQIGGQVGAGIDWRYFGNAANPRTINPYSQTNAPRAAGFMESVRQAQLINPGASVADIGASVGGYLANTGAQQLGAFQTGGAFSMIGAGGGAKSISEWAESILKWFMNQRPGGDRGKPFSYGQLMSQNFPGSNMDAWFAANGVPQDMRNYWWSYALGKASTTGTTGGDAILQRGQATPGATTNNLAYQRLASENSVTRSGFQLGGTLSGTYGNKEQSNRWFNDLMGQMINQVLPSAMSSGNLSFMQYLPDAMQDILMQLSERTTLGSLGAGFLGWGSIPALQGASTKIEDTVGKLAGWIGGDVGDVGDWGPMGGSTTAGLSLDMRPRVQAMMRANPRLRMNSGLRDMATQGKLKRKGAGRVSGRPSAHTRGQAADLGPSSEYGWLVSNAGKFGLKSGIGAGEPWHVGLGDPDGSVGSGGGGGSSGSWGGTDSNVGGLLGMIQSLFGGFGSAITSDDPSTQISGIATGTSTILKALMSLFAGGTTDYNALAQRDVYSQLVSATNSFLGSGKTGLPAGFAGGSSSSIPASAGGAIGGATLDAFFRQVLAGLGAPITTNNLLKLAAVTKAEGNGSDFNPFNSMGGNFPNKANSAGVENYPDWQTGVDYTIQLLSQTSGKGNTSLMRGNLTQDASYSDWFAKTNAFYTGWGGSPLPNISQSSASAMLSQPVHGAGDVEYADMGNGGVMVRGGHTFYNSFVINGGNGGANGGIDTRRVASQLADQLEDQLQQRMSRMN